MAYKMKGYTYPGKTPLKQKALGPHKPKRDGSQDLKPIGTYKPKPGDRTSGPKPMSSTPVKHADTPLHKKSLVDKVQTGLAVGGMAPVFGAVPDLLNTGISGARAIKARLTGDKEGAKEHLKKAAISGISTIPGPGDAVGAKALSDDLGYKKKEHKWKQNIPEKGYRDIKKT